MSVSYEKFLCVVFMFFLSPLFYFIDQAFGQYWKGLVHHTKLLVCQKMMLINGSFLKISAVPRHIEWKDFLMSKCLTEHTCEMSDSFITKRR